MAVIESLCRFGAADSVGEFPKQRTYEFYPAEFKELMRLRLNSPTVSNCLDRLMIYTRTAHRKLTVYEFLFSKTQTSNQSELSARRRPLSLWAPKAHFVTCHALDF
jgi:hypothetical protein